MEQKTMENREKSNVKFFKKVSSFIPQQIFCAPASQI